MSGSCLCGAIRFSFQNLPQNLYQCHCSLCRKQSGGAANVATLIDSGSFSWEKGRDLIQSYVKPTGFRSDFCSKCGSPVPNPVGESSYLWIPAGLLDSSENLKISAHLFVGSKAEWESKPLEGIIFDDAPGIQNLYDILHCK